jgi:hypothetical protein
VLLEETSFVEVKNKRLPLSFIARDEEEIRVARVWLRMRVRLRKSSKPTLILTNKID